MASSNIDTPTSRARPPHNSTSTRRSLTCCSTAREPPTSTGERVGPRSCWRYIFVRCDGMMVPPSCPGADADMELDAGRHVLAWDDGEIETIAVEDSRRNRHLNNVVEEQRAGALTSRATLAPRFSTPAALVARQPHWHFYRYRDAPAGLARGDADGHRPPSRRLVHQKPPPDPIDCQCDRRKVDDDFVSEAAGVD